MPMLPLYIKTKFYAKPAVVLLKASFYAYYFRTKHPCESPAACAIMCDLYTKAKFYANFFNEWEHSLIALMTGSYPHLSASQEGDIRIKFCHIYTISKGYTKTKFYANCFNEWEHSLIALMTGSYPHLSAPQEEDVRI